MIVVIEVVLLVSNIKKYLKTKQIRIINKYSNKSSNQHNYQE